jgi:hypothetical protein
MVKKVVNLAAVVGPLSNAVLDPNTGCSAISHHHFESPTAQCCTVLFTSFYRQWRRIVSVELS